MVYVVDTPSVTVVLMVIAWQTFSVHVDVITDVFVVTTTDDLILEVLSKVEEWDSEGT